ncbi:MAG TPA: hypothetical protein VG847_00930 [Chitinophagaceae bacterium]|nr:hypothetical protein [Chitinophagaceae bacterium]
MKFLLFYQTYAYGISVAQIEKFDELSQMDSRVNDLLNKWGEDFTIFFSGQILKEFEYVPSEIIKALKRKD